MKKNGDYITNFTNNMSDRLMQTLLRNELK
jgi:hypothetical protein